MALMQNMTTALLVLFIAGCASPEPPAPKKNVFDPLTQDVERARAVQKTVDDHADATRKAVDNQERGDTPP
jgi:PBP1b-binding outer membrane lipoprotein LpoB